MSAPLDASRARELLYEMLRIRRFEARAAELYGAEKIRGFLHLYDGEEAVAVGVMRALTARDSVVATYREHGQALARGLPAGEVMAELYGKQEGSSKGRGGSMHVFDKERRFFGGNAIVGGGLPIAVGLALAETMRATNAVVACFFGDGAVAEGEFHESMNLAQLWRLPVLFVCENNLYAMGTALRRAQAQTRLVDKAQAYAMRAVAVDGMDAVLVEDTAQALVQGMRAGGGPAFFEARTYRFRAHSMFDAQLYRSKEEVDEQRERDPITQLAERALSLGLLSAEEVAALERKADAEVDEAVAFAERGTLEPVSELLDDVYTAKGTP